MAILCDGEGDIPDCAHLPDLLETSFVPFFALPDGSLARGVLLAPGQYALDMSCRGFLQTYLTVAIFCDGEGDIPDSAPLPVCLETSVVPFFATLGSGARGVRFASDEHAL